MQVSRSDLPKIVIAGATGFVGRHLARALYPTHYIIGLSRTSAHEVGKNHSEQSVDEWRECDLLSLLQTEQALVGAEYAYYLVHSMMPSARLTQAEFWNLDLIAADNFARAAHRAKIKQIIYLGGMVP